MEVIGNKNEAKTGNRTLNSVHFIIFYVYLFCFKIVFLFHHLANHTHKNR